MPAAITADTLGCRIAAAVRGVAGYFMKPRSRYWLARLYISASVLVTTSIGFLEPLSFQQRVLANISGGLVFLLVAMVLASIALVDTVVNDLLPDHLRFDWLDRHRLEVFAVLMMSLAALAWMNGAHGASWLLVMRYGVDTLACAGVCIFDTVARAKYVAQVSGG